MHELGVLLDFKESTIHIDNILLPMRDIANLQLKFSITRALQNNTNHAQAPVITHSTTKGVVEILDAKYEISDIPPAIGREDCSHLSATGREKRWCSMVSAMIEEWGVKERQNATIKFQLK